MDTETQAIERAQTKAARHGTRYVVIERTDGVEGASPLETPRWIVTKERDLPPTLHEHARIRHTFG